MTSVALKASVAPVVPADDGADGEWTLRMKDLCSATGLQRQAIHFYIKEGLLPPGRKTGRNMAYYGPVHLERLELVRRLQEERFLPLKAIKAVLDGGDGQYTPEQRQWLRDLKRRVATTLARGADAPESVPAEPLLTAHGVSAVELAELDEAGVVPVGRDAHGRPVVSAADAWAVEALGELRRLGFTPERGFGVAEIALYERFVSALFDAETTLLSERLTHLDTAEAAQMVERVLPLVHRFITRFHEAKIRRFFAAME
ncbi:MAG: MerR family transcriptional regulator [Deltaproteobacteria bacterium]|nr:MAG: MerR family transcriptional regulator [Deltaproteobacteria bacterium]